MSPSSHQQQYSHSTEVTVIIQSSMKKSNNNQRRSSFCPNHMQKQKCCCHSQTHSLRHKTKPKGKNNSIRNINESNMSYVNSTLPMVTSFVPDLRRSILDQNSILRTENDILKRELSTQYQSSHQVSSFVKDERNNISTFVNSESETSRTMVESKLFVLNRNIQEYALQLDARSRQNKQLNQKNTIIQRQVSHAIVRNQQLELQNRELKNKIKKLNKRVQNGPKQEQIKQILEQNCWLQRQRTSLLSQIEDLKMDLKGQNSQTIIQGQNLSPGWVAHTSTKINAIQKNISKLEQENKENLIPNGSLYLQKEKQKTIQNEVQLIKKQIISTIKFLKVQSQSFKFGVSTFDQFMESSNPSMLLLVKNLCESLFEPIQNIYIEINKSLDRKLKAFENKFNKIIQKLQNTMMKMKNSHLRQQSKTKTIF